MESVNKYTFQRLRDCAGSFVEILKLFDIFTIFRNILLTNQKVICEYFFLRKMDLEPSF